MYFDRLAFKLINMSVMHHIALYVKIKTFYYSYILVYKWYYA